MTVMPYLLLIWSLHNGATVVDQKEYPNKAACDTAAQAVLSAAAAHVPKRRDVKTACVAKYDVD
jgi:hypothetical protein